MGPALTQLGTDAALALFRNLGVLSYAQTVNHIPGLSTQEYSAARIRHLREEPKKEVFKPVVPKPAAPRRPHAKGKFSKVEKIMLAASQLNQPFTKAQLVVKAWELYPEDFCLAGFPQFPDSNKIISHLCGERGLVGKGIFESTKANEYSITKFGNFVLKEVKSEI